MSLRGVETLELFGCRSFNGINGAKLSEHGHANALDVRSLKIANGTVIELTNATVSKPLREQLRQTAALAFRRYSATEQMRIMKTMSISI